MTEPFRGEVRFALGSGDALTEEGVPLSEVALEMEVGPCIHCGKTPDEQSRGGALERVYVEEGVLKGDAVCRDCLEFLDDPAVASFALLDEQVDEG